MNEETRTLNAFLTAVTQLQEPLPANMVQQLHEIEKGLPESIYKLYELTEQFAPLHGAYTAALHSQSSDGERLKASSTATLPVSSNDLDQLLVQLRYQIALLQDTHAEDRESDEELEHWQNSPEAEHMEQQWMATFANSQDVLDSLANEALREFRWGLSSLPNFKQMPHWRTEIIELAQQDALDLLHSRVVEQEVLDLLDEP